LIVRQEIFAYVNHARIRSCNQPVLSKEGKVSGYRKQFEPLMKLEFTNDRLWVRCATHCASPPLWTCWFTWHSFIVSTSQFMPGLYITSMIQTNIFNKKYIMEFKF